MKLWKIVISVFVIFIITKNAQAQYYLCSEFQLSDSWRSIPIALSKEYRQHTFSIIIKTGFDAKMIYDQNHVFKRRFYSENFLQRFSYGFQYDYNFKNWFSNWYPSLFYHCSFTRAPARSRAYLPKGIDDDEIFYYHLIDIELKPMNSLENYLGLMLSFSLMPKLDYVQKIGIGYNLISDIDPVLGHGYKGEFGHILSWGIKYQISE